MLYLETLNQKLIKEFKEKTGQPIHYFCDITMSFLQRRFVFDLIKFDNWLIVKWGQYKINESMKKRIKVRYGKSMAEFIITLL